MDGSKKIYEKKGGKGELDGKKKKKKKGRAGGREIYDDLPPETAISNQTNGRIVCYYCAGSHTRRAQHGTAHTHTDTQLTYQKVPPFYI